MCKTDDEAIKRWERFAEAGNKEKEWMHVRLSWLFVPQGIFFGALAWIIKLSTDAGESEHPELLLLKAVVICAGFLLSFATFFGTIAAGTMHYKWTSTINTLAKNINSTVEQVPFGSGPYWPARSSSLIPSFIALVFVVSWAILIYFNEYIKILVGICSGASVTLILLTMFLAYKTKNNA